MTTSNNFCKGCTPQAERAKIKDQEWKSGEKILWEAANPTRPARGLRERCKQGSRPRMHLGGCIKSPENASSSSATLFPAKKTQLPLKTLLTKAVTHQRQMTTQNFRAFKLPPLNFTPKKIFFIKKFSSKNKKNCRPCKSFILGAFRAKVKF